MKKNNGIVWLRNDFRTLNNDALSYASQNHEHVCAFFIFKKNDFNNRSAQLWWLYQSLKDFKKKLNQFNINLEIVEANSYKEIFEKIISKKNFSIYWNKVYEPNYLIFDKKYSSLLESKKINFKIFKGNLLNEAHEIKKADNTPYKVFTPFWRTAEKYYLEKRFRKNHKIKIQDKKTNFLSQTVNLDSLLTKKKWHLNFEKLWIPSEEIALKNTKYFIKNCLSNYGKNRDIPSIEGTSKISPYLAFGQIHVETILEECQKIGIKNNGYRKYIN